MRRQLAKVLAVTAVTALTAMVSVPAVAAPSARGQGTLIVRDTPDCSGTGNASTVVVPFSLYFTGFEPFSQGTVTAYTQPGGDEVGSITATTNANGQLCIRVDGDPAPGQYKIVYEFDDGTGKQKVIRIESAGPTPTPTPTATVTTTPTPTPTPTPPSRGRLRRRCRRHRRPRFPRHQLVQGRQRLLPHQPTSRRQAQVRPHLKTRLFFRLSTSVVGWRTRAE